MADSQTGRVVCLCTHCRLLTHRDEHNELRQGNWVSPRTKAAHEVSDRMKALSEIEETRERIENVILLDTLSSETGSDLHSLPVRPRDIEYTTSSDTVASSAGQASITIMHQPASISQQEDTMDTLPPLGSRTQTLSAASSRLDDALATLSQITTLLFTTSPTTLFDSMGELDRSDPPTAQFLTLEEAFVELKGLLSGLHPIGDLDADERLRHVAKRAETSLRRLDDFRVRAWEKLRIEVAVRDLTKANRRDATQPGADIKRLQPFVVAALIMTVVLHALAGTARGRMHYVFATIEVLIYGAFAFSSPSPNFPFRTNAGQEEVLNTIPRDVRFAISTLGLEPDVVAYACCPRCFATYPPDASRPDDPYPHLCTFQETDKPVCGSPIVQKEVDQDDATRSRFLPLRCYPYHPLSSWLANILRKPGMANLTKKAWNTSSQAPRVWRDIWDAPILRSFPSPDNMTPFSSQPTGCIHLVFSLFVDWFNPFGNKKGGKSHSIGGVYMACLNLPPDLRYRPENIYLAGIIPGPKEPELHQLNHLLRPLVDELIVLWRCGLYLAHVADEEGLVLVRAALVPLVCDLPALRKAGGFAGHSANKFCSFCQLPKQRMDDLDRSQWGKSTREDHLRVAKEWLDAPSEAVRDEIFKRHGIRWSELLRLDYWDPTRFALVDAMHNLFLGELRHHCMEVWGIDIKGKSPDELKLTPHTPEEQQKWLDFLVNALRKGPPNKIMKARKGYLVALAELNGALPPAGKLTKADFAHSLLVWAQGSGAPLDSIKIPPVLDTPTNDFHLVKNPYDISKHRVLNHTLLSQIRDDIATTILPSWMERAPRNFGSAGHGKLKADQWRTVCTVNLVITLTRIWGTSTASARDKVLLLNFLHLVCAVDLASRRTMSDVRARRFDEHILKYLETLRSIFDHRLVPNHHLSLHLEECLRAFGPVHAWWAFPFERFNGLLARFNTNYKPHEMPTTFLRYFYIGTGLRGLIADYHWPDSDVYQRMLHSFRTAFRDHAKGSYLLFHSDKDAKVDSVSYDEKREVLLPRDIYDGILMRVWTPAAPFASMYSSSRTQTPRLYGRAVELPSYTHHGVTFATAKAQLRNSFIVFDHPHPSPASSSHFPSAGQISRIFLHGRATDTGRLVEPMFIVDVYKALATDHAPADPYRPYKDLQTRLFYRIFEEKQAVLTIQDIRAHFAAYFYVPDEIARECVVVRSLDRT